jgi:hypothetical protein
MNVHLDCRTEDDVKFIREILQIHGKTIKRFSWTNLDSYQFDEGKLVELLNFLPNLENIELSCWKSESVNFKNSQKLYRFQNLKQLYLSECDCSIVEFLARNLPKNVLNEFRIELTKIPSEMLTNFCCNQRKIKSLDIMGRDFSDARAFDSLKLNQLRCGLIKNKSPSEQQAFLRALIHSQPELTVLDTLSKPSNPFILVNDDIFEEIINCQFLTSLRMHFDEVSSYAISKLGNLKALTTFELKTKLRTSLEVFNVLSLLNLPIENLILNLWDFDLPQQTYRQFGKNFNLKSLTINLGTTQTIPFFIETFPKLESLSIRFGKANEEVDFSQVFSGNDLKIHNNMKSLKFDLWASRMVTVKKFSLLLSCFPKLERLKINARFSSKLLKFMLSHENHLKNVQIKEIWIDQDKFSADEITATLKTLNKMFDLCHFTLRHARAPDRESSTSENFLFKHLKESLRDYFRIDEMSWCNFALHEQLRLKTFV